MLHPALVLGEGEGDEAGADDAGADDVGSEGDDVPDGDGGAVDVEMGPEDERSQWEGSEVSRCPHEFESQLRTFRSMGTTRHSSEYHQSWWKDSALG